MDLVLNSERNQTTTNVSNNVEQINSKKISTSSTGGSQERPIKYHIK
jgi:hypothetical protein